MNQDRNPRHSGRQAEVIAFLCEPASYGCQGQVERIDTHAAIVFLAGDRAYKLKRAVRYPYLDFSTPEKRKAVCEAELVLNRRTAPDLYLEMRFVGREPGGRLAFGEGKPLDWVVVMQRFAPECLMARMVEEGGIDPAIFRQLADTIARFHDGAQIVPGHGVRRVRKVIEGNRASMAALPAGTLDSASCERLYRNSFAVMTDLSLLLERRSDQGLVRHCHGDLHLANICIWHGRPTLFDCLEFDADLATSDLLYDLAFLLMDLWHRGLHAEASLVFNRYCDRRGEIGGLPALPLFLSMRAAVRAHVEASAAGRQQEAAAREKKLAGAHGYLTAAGMFLERPEPRIIAIGGVSGSGKSTLAGKLAPYIGSAPGARWLRTDMLRKQLAGVEPEVHLPDSAYTPETHDRVYAALLERTRETLLVGWPVIVDALFDFPESRSRFEALAATLDVPFEGIWLDADRDTLIARVRSRRGDASDAGPPVVDKQLKRDIGPLGCWRKIDAGKTAADTLGRALRLIGQAQS